MHYYTGAGGIAGRGRGRCSGIRVGVGTAWGRCVADVCVMCVCVVCVANTCVMWVADVWMADVWV